MLAGSDRGLQCCLRGKVDTQHPNKSLRDPVYYLCNPMPHHRIGPKYKIYPTYDLSCPFVDSIQGTHALRSSEYHDKNDLYLWIQETMGLRKVHIYEFSRLNIVYTPLSKQKLLWFVENEMVEGWDDAHFPTMQGMVRRGLKMEALIQFILEQGPSKNLNLMEWDKLWSINKKIIDPVVLDTLQLLKKVKDSDGNVTELNGVLPPEGSVYKTTKLKLTWLPEINELSPLTLLEFGYLLKKNKLGDNEKLIDTVNPNSKKEITAVRDENMRKLKHGEILQLERKGYFRCDVLFSPSKPIVLYAILDGRQK
ncbi:glutamate--tRNA ligase, cytoplasmic [Tanacetum coccineum]